MTAHPAAADDAAARSVRLRLTLLVIMTAVIAAAHGHHTFMGDDLMVLAISAGKGWNLLRHVDSVLEPHHYAPVTSFVMMIQGRLFGLNAFPFYLVACLIHLGSACVIGRIVDRLADARAGTAAALSFFALFNHFEVTAWIAAANYGGLSFLFLCLAVMFHQRHREDGERRAAPLSVLCYLLALLSKEDGLAFLPIIAGYELVRGGSARGRLRGVAIVQIGVTLLYLWHARGRMAGNHYTDYVVSLSPEWHWLTNLLLYAGVLASSLLLPDLTIRFLPLKALGAAALFFSVGRYRRWTPLGRWGVLWIVAGLALCMPFLTPWQSRYTLVASGGFALLLADLARRPRLRQALIVLLIASFACRMVASEKKYRYLPVLGGPAPSHEQTRLFRDWWRAATNRGGAP